MSSNPSERHRFVFIGGLHRSGTSAICAMIGAHPQASRLEHTGQIEDEGQFLQSVYPVDDALGGAERFALHPDAHMTERSPLVEGAGAKLFESWAPYWNLSKPVLCEKTPANMVRSRFLQAAFPNASFIFVSRHPVACALAIRKWEYSLYRQPLELLIRNWIASHSYMKEDHPHLRRALLLRYEDITADPVVGVRRIENFLQIEQGLSPSSLKQGMNRRYFETWANRSFRKGPQRLRNILKRIWCEAEVRLIEARYERAINEFGYSFGDIWRCESGAEPRPAQATAHS
jgi:Sulfotransferase family